MYERWVDVVGFEKLYQVSNIGAIRSLYIRNRNTQNLCHGTNKFGYKNVALYKNIRQGIWSTFFLY